MTSPRRVGRPALTYAITGIVVIAVWWVAVSATGVKAYLLPPPDLVVMKMWTERASLLREAAVTAWETVLGFLLSVAVGIPLAMAMTQSRRAYDVGYPLLVGLQTLPKIAVAPLLVVALGFGLAPKIILVVLVAFFPVVTNAIAGFRSVDEDLRNLGRILGFSRIAFFWRIALPYALPAIFAGLKVAMTLALIGAVVAEFVGSDSGLGYQLLSASASLDSLLSFSALIALTLLGLLLYAAVALLEWIFVASRRTSEPEPMGGY
jgi:NitT/TauT family transport system permease protein